MRYWWVQRLLPFNLWLRSKVRYITYVGLGRISGLSLASDFIGRLFIVSKRFL
jgi:hypothetical protein